MASPDKKECGREATITCPASGRLPRQGRRRLLGAVTIAAAALTRLWAADEPATSRPLGHIVVGQPDQRVAVPDCIAKKGDAASREACQVITQVLRADLKFEGAFQFVPEGLFSHLAALNPDSPNFEDWKSIRANVLVVTTAEPTGADMTVMSKVYFVDSGQNILWKSYPAKAGNLRVVAHKASDDIVALAQERGVASTKIVFTSDRDSTKEKRAKELYVIDYDGYNPRRLTTDLHLNILPAWSPDGRSVAFISYRSSPEIFVTSILEGQTTNVTGGRTGQPYAVSWSPDGRQIAYASNKTGNVEIWVANADGSDARRMTDSPGLDTAPAWSPTGREIAFTSSRSGTPQIWVMDAEGLNVRRLTTVGTWNDAPAWNPSKQFSEIAYASRLEHGREVAVIDLATRQVRQITQGRGDCESPSWAPNGRHLVFACDDGLSSQIVVSDRYGREVHTLAPGPGNNSQPDWGP